MYDAPPCVAEEDSTHGEQAQTAAEHVGDALGLLERRVDGDVRRFKDFIEARGQETGAWRGEIHGARVQS